MKQYPIIILGAGPAGLGAARSLHDAQQPFAVLEKENLPGGLMRSYKADGFTFDLAGHIFFSRLKGITELFLNILGNNVHEVTRHSIVHLRERLINFPFQANLKNLPYPVLKECLLSFIYNWFQENKSSPTNFREWIYHAYGKGIAETFMIPYNEKLWTYNLEDISMDWIKDRIPHPDFEDVIEGALKGANTSMGQNATFYYPLEGGMYSFIKNFISSFSDHILTGEKVIDINPRKQVVTTENNAYRYQQLISTIPLPDLCEMASIPASLQDAVSQLRHVSVFCVNIGAEKKVTIPYHWYYFPEKKYIFHRIFVQHNASPHNVPPHHNSFIAEISYSDYKPIDKEKAPEQTINGLIDAGLVNSQEDIKHMSTVDIPYGYVVYNRYRKNVLQKLRDYFQGHNIHLLGRYGTWEYYNMDHALQEGLQKGKELI